MKTSIRFWMVPAGTLGSVHFLTDPQVDEKDGRLNRVPWRRPALCSACFPVDPQVDEEDGRLNEICMMLVSTLGSARF